MDEKTIYDSQNSMSEDTQINGANDAYLTPQPTSETRAEAKAKQSSHTAKIVAGAAGGVLLGGVAVGLTSMASNGDEAADKAEVDSTQPDWLVNPEVKVATGVTDDMSFDEAFAAARAEVGAGGTFEWHGGVYGTYTASEWSHMTAAERAEWNDNFSWGHLDSHHTSTAHTSTHNTTTVHETNVIVENHTHNHTNNGDEAMHTAGRTSTTSVTNVSAGDDGRVQVLAVVHNDENNTNIGMIRIDGEEMYVVDVDNDMKFDVLLSDTNHDGEFSDDEFIDISQNNLTVDSLGGFHVSNELQAELQQQQDIENGALDGPDYAQRSADEDISDYATNEEVQAQVAEVTGADHDQFIPGAEAEVAAHMPAEDVEVVKEYDFSGDAEVSVTQPEIMHAEVEPVIVAETQPAEGVVSDFDSTDSSVTAELEMPISDSDFYGENLSDDMPFDPATYDGSDTDSVDYTDGINYNDGMA